MKQYFCVCCIACVYVYKAIEMDTKMLTCRMIISAAYTCLCYMIYFSRQCVICRRKFYVPEEAVHWAFWVY